MDIPAILQYDLKVHGLFGHRKADLAVVDYHEVVALVWVIRYPVHPARLKATRHHRQVQKLISIGHPAVLLIHGLCEVDQAAQFLADRWRSYPDVPQSWPPPGQVTLRGLYQPSKPPEPAPDLQPRAWLLSHLEPCLPAHPFSYAGNPAMRERREGEKGVGG